MQYSFVFINGVHRAARLEFSYFLGREHIIICASMVNNSKMQKKLLKLATFQNTLHGIKFTLRESTSNYNYKDKSIFPYVYFRNCLKSLYHFQQNTK